PTELTRENASVFFAASTTVRNGSGLAPQPVSATAAASTQVDVTAARLLSMAPRTALMLAALVAAGLLIASAFAVATRASVRGNPTAGKALFVRPGVFCGSCHTLKAAKSTGRDGPNLDR